MIDPNRERRYWGGNLRRFEIHRMGRERFSKLIQTLNPYQLEDLQKIHQNLEDHTKILTTFGTLISVGSAVAVRYSLDQENAVAFTVFSIGGALIGATGTYYRAAAREALGMVSRRISTFQG